MQIFEDYIEADSLLLLDEPEVSLSPENQLKLAATINQAARLLDTQFIISTHSPLLLGSLDATIYDLDRPGLQTANWRELETVKTYATFFKDHY